MISSSVITFDIVKSGALHCGIQYNMHNIFLDVYCYAEIEYFAYYMVVCYFSFRNLFVLWFSKIFAVEAGDYHWICTT